MAGRLRVGIIGVGGISKVHLEGYAKIDYADVVAFCDIIPERAERGAKQYGAPDAKVFTDYKEMLEMEDLDSVDICTPNRWHAPMTIDALRAGKHVFSEKPMAITSKDAGEMVKAATETGLKLTVGYQSRFADDARLLKKMVDEGELGRVYYAEALAVRRRGVPTWGVFLSKEDQGGGPLIDIGTHVVDRTLWLMGDYSKPVSVLASTYDELAALGGYNSWGPWDPQSFEVEDGAFGLVKLESGATVLIKATWALNIDRDQHGSLLCGTKAGASLCDGLKINGEAHNRLWEYTPVPVHSADSLYDREIAYWADCLVNDTEPLVKAEEAAQVVRVLEAMYQSAERGEAVNLS